MRLVYTLIAFALLATSPAYAQPQQATCTSAFGRTVCGYNCVAAYGQIKCASTPWGACHSAYGKVVCGPNTPMIPGVDMPKASCKAAYGQIACGYNCVAAYGQVRCATDPWGACTSAYGKVTCTADNQQLGLWLQRGVTVPDAQCLSAYGTSACGWGCVQGQGTVACSPNPWGTCAVARGEVQCSNPAATPVQHAHFDHAPVQPVQAECKSAYGKTACGYHCAAAYGQVKCSSNPNGACKAAYGSIECF